MAFPGLVIGGVEQNLNLGGNVGGFDNVRLKFYYGLPEGVSINRDDIEALVCRTQDYLGEVIYNEFVGQELEVKVSEIVWKESKEEERILDVGFTTTLTGINGTAVSEMPTPENLREAFDGLDMNGYLGNTVRVSQCPSGFSLTTKVEYETNLAPEITGTIREPNCKITCAPTISPGVPTSESSTHVGSDGLFSH